MCGITGLLHYAPEVSAAPRQLRRMVATLHHRGPDDDGIFIDGAVGLGARRLQVIDPEGGSQPLVDRKAQLAMVLNGEIYNHDSLRAELAARGHRFATRSDTEVILRAYAEYGEACLHRLRGMFAFAIWNGARRELFLARDRIGVKPLYYHWDGETFLFGSEIKAILAHPAGDRRLDAAALDDFLTFNYIPAPRSIYRSIRKLPPAHWLRLDAHGLHLGEYWDLTFEPDESGDETARIEALRAQVLDSVQSHLVSDVPLGVFLSGGVDSSVVAAAMTLASGTLPNAVSLGFEEPEFDERPYAREVATACGGGLRTRSLRAQAVGIVDVLVNHFDEPFADSSMVPTWYLSQLARESATVCLSGDGGDEMFAGYPRFATFVERAAVDVAAAERAYFDDRTWISRDLRSRLYRDSLRRELDGYDPFSVLQGHFDRTREWDPLSRIQYLETKTYLPGDLLTKVDRASMAHGLEVRVPLLDHLLVEQAARIPARCKLRDGRGKDILKRAFRPNLPASVLQRPKMGFSMPLALWLRGELRGWFESRVLTGDSPVGEWLDMTVVRTCWNEHQGSRHDHNRFLWSLVVLDAWARRFLT